MEAYYSHAMSAAAAAGRPGAILQQQQPESGYQLLKALTFIANSIAIQAYLGHEMDQHSTLALQYGY